MFAVSRSLGAAPVIGGRPGTMQTYSGQDRPGSGLESPPRPNIAPLIWAEVQRFRRAAGGRGAKPAEPPDGAPLRPLSSNPAHSLSRDPAAGESAPNNTLHCPPEGPLDMYRRQRPWASAAERDLGSRLPARTTVHH